MQTCSGLTLIGTHGNSGNAFATALAPASFVKSERPTKNSFPVNNTSPPSSFALGSAISTSAKSSSFFSIARMFSTCKWIGKKPDTLLFHFHMNISIRKLHHKLAWSSRTPICSERNSTLTLTTFRFAFKVINRKLALQRMPRLALWVRRKSVHWTFQMCSSDSALKRFRGELSANRIKKILQSERKIINAWN